MSLLQMSFTGAVMILAVVIVRTLTLNKLPKITFLALWGIVLCRLLLPVSIPSGWSVYSFLEQKASFFESSHSAEAFLMWPVAIAHSSDAYKRLVAPWTVLWTAGTVVCAALFLLAHQKCRWEFRVSLPVQNDFAEEWLRSHPLRRPLSIRLSDRFSTPLTYGVLRPVILMPRSTNWENTEELQYVLTHEYIHVCRFDAAKKLLLAAALCVHWFNPFVWVMYFFANRDIELACDEAVIHVFGVESRAFYARTLIHMRETQNHFVPLGSGFGKDAAEERICVIMKTRKPTIFSAAAASALVLGTVLLFATSPKAAVCTDSTSAYSMTTVSGVIYRSKDQQIWLSEKEYNELYPQQDIAWWTYEEYKAYLDEQIPVWQSFVDQGAKHKNDQGKWVPWTQEEIDEVIMLYKENLEAIRQGAKLSKDAENITFFIKNSAEPSVVYSASIVDPKGKEIDLGTFSTKGGQRKALQT